ncbi:hypothetical protein Ddye_016475 [Dipteronia dyeriana]|uniref:Uncharacterized protein n=1 Tax=Dipteronia dyeriana TaxID=168575 RepID=A0AAD9U6V1_9ROSI|nr:hypothetical protein Ddye_016475 [Dipteronia dyeriana]
MPLLGLGCCFNKNAVKISCFTSLSLCICGLFRSLKNRFLKIHLMAPGRKLKGSTSLPESVGGPNPPIPTTESNGLVSESMQTNCTGVLKSFFFSFFNFRFIATNITH